LIACKTTSTTPATTVLTIQSGAIVEAPLPTGGTSANTSSISNVPAAEVCAKLIACAANSTTPAATVLTVQSGAVVLAPLPTGGTASNTTSISSVPAAEVCAKLIACKTTSTTPATTVLTIQAGAIVEAPIKIDCADLLAKLDSCLPTIKASCDPIKYLLGNQSGAIEKVPSHSYASLYQGSNSVPLAVPVPAQVINKVKFLSPSNPLQTATLGCANSGDISDDGGGTYTILRDMFVSITYNVLLVGSGTTAAISYDVGLTIINQTHAVIGTTASGSFLSTSKSIPASETGFIFANGTWSGFVGAGAKIYVYTYSGNSLGVTHNYNNGGSQHISFVEQPRVGFSHY
jgi:hypothetical protein